MNRDIVLIECGKLLNYLERQKHMAQRKPEEKILIFSEVITEYQKVLLRLERMCVGRDVRRYLKIRRARHAVKQGMEKEIVLDVLYSWLVENVCDVEIR